jgi:hypothetical protein
MAVSAEPAGRGVTDVAQASMSSNAVNIKPKLMIVFVIFSFAIGSYRCCLLTIK